MATAVPEQTNGPAGNGAAAASYLNGADSSGIVVPKVPEGPPSGRPQPRKDVGDTPEEGMWRALLQGAMVRSSMKSPDLSESRSNSQEHSDKYQRCVALAAQLQRTSLELVAAGRVAGLNESLLKRLACDNLFRPCPNPQDGAREEEPRKEPESPGRKSVHVLEEPVRNSSEKEPDKSSGKEPAATPGSRPSLIATHGDQPKEATPIRHRKSVMHLSSETLARRKSLKSATGAGICVSKHLHGCPSTVYDLGVQVGAGTFGTVRKARHKATGQIHAVKKVIKDELEVDKLWAEINIMKQLDHPHIMRLYYTFEDDTSIYMASEMCAGGELYDTIDEAGFLTERTCALIFHQILGAVNYLHCKSIAHRDLKPENFLVLKRVDYHLIQLKLIDFGTSRRFDTGEMTTKVCTAHYVAPEVLKRGQVAYTEKVDIWSCGAILYMMLCGFMPFHHDNNLELLKLVKKGKYQFSPDRVWKLISAEAKDLVSHMMCIKVADRFTATECVQHEWIVDKQGDTSSVDEAIVRQMRIFLTNNRLKRVALQIIARQIHDESVERLRNIFMGIDEDCSGCLTIDEMKEALKELDLSEASQQEMAQILVCVDQDQSGTIEWTEFLAATLTKEQYLQEDACRGAFILLDVDQDGVLNRQDLSSFLAAQDGSDGILAATTMIEIEQIMRDTDENGDGDVSFEEFMILMNDEGPKAAESAVSLRYRRGKKEHTYLLAQEGSHEKGHAEVETELDEVFQEDENPDNEDDDERIPPKEHVDTHTGWVQQSQKAWDLEGKSCTLTVHAKEDEGLLRFEVHLLATGEILTAAGSKEDFEMLCKEKEQSGMSGPAAADAAVRQLLGGAP